MVKPLVERQMRFRAKRKAQGGIRLDMWLPEEEAAMLKKLRVWRGQRSYPQVVLDLVNETWIEEVKKAAADGHPDAQFEYAFVCIARGRELGPKGEAANNSEAQEWFTKSYKQGYRVDACYNNLGVLLTESDDYESAVEWFQKSVEQGNRVAQYNVGVLALVIQDYRQAAEWFRKSAEQGWKLAQRNLGVLYALGKGITEDYEKALEWLRMWKGGDSTMACENLLAHWLSTFPKDDWGLRNGQLATTIAERLVRLSRKSTSTKYLYTLAEAYAEAGRFEEAINTQKKLLLRLRQRYPSAEHRDAVLGDCWNRLNSYRNRVPWRDNEVFNEFWFSYDSLGTMGHLLGLRRFFDDFDEEVQTF